jgi:hypothetical protein
VPTTNNKQFHDFMVSVPCDQNRLLGLLELATYNCRRIIYSQEILLYGVETKWLSVADRPCRKTDSSATFSPSPTPMHMHALNGEEFKVKTHTRQSIEAEPHQYTVAVTKGCPEGLSLKTQLQDEG